MNRININELDLNLFKVLEALYVEESAGRAALRLGITQSAVSAALNRLRKIYGDHLFERTGRGLKPTTKASELKSSVGDILENAVRRCRRQWAAPMILPSGPLFWPRLMTLR